MARNFFTHTVGDFEGYREESASGYVLWDVSCHSERAGLVQYTCSS